MEQGLPLNSWCILVIAQQATMKPYSHQKLFERPGFIQQPFTFSRILFLPLLDEFYEQSNLEGAVRMKSRAWVGYSWS